MWHAEHNTCVMGEVGFEPTHNINYSLTFYIFISFENINFLEESIKAEIELKFGFMNSFSTSLEFYIAIPNKNKY